MSLSDRIGLGFTFSFDGVLDSGGVTLSIVDPGMSDNSTKATAATSKLGDDNDTFLGGSVDPGELTFSVAFHPESTAWPELETWHQATGQASLRTCEIAWPALGEEAAGTSTGSGILTGMNRTINRNELVVVELTIKKSGEWLMVDGSTGS